MRRQRRRSEQVGLFNEAFDASTANVLHLEEAVAKWARGPSSLLSGLHVPAPGIPGSSDEWHLLVAGFTLVLVLLLSALAAVCWRRPERGAAKAGKPEKVQRQEKTEKPKKQEKVENLAEKDAQLAPGPGLPPPQPKEVEESKDLESVEAGRQDRMWTSASSGGLLATLSTKPATRLDDGDHQEPTWSSAGRGDMPATLSAKPAACLDDEDHQESTWSSDGRGDMPATLSTKPAACLDDGDQSWIAESEDWEPAEAGGQEGLPATPSKKQATRPDDEAPADFVLRSMGGHRRRSQQLFRGATKELQDQMLRRHTTVTGLNAPPSEP